MRKDIRWIRILLTIIVVVIFILVLKNLKNIFIPLIFSLFLSFMFSPLHRFLRKRKIPRYPAIVIVILSMFVVFSSVGALMYTGVKSFINEFPLYEEKMYTMVDTLVNKINPEFTTSGFIGSFKSSWLNIAEQLSLTDFVSNTMGTFMDFFFNLLLSMVFLIFILAEKEKFSNRILKSLTQAEANFSVNITDKIEDHVQNYILIKTLVSFFTGLTAMGLMWIFGIPFIAVGGLLHFVLNYIPNVGSFLASGLVVALYGLNSGFNMNFVLVALLFLAMQFFWGTFIEPRWMGTKFKVSPVVIISSLIFWAWVWGGIGMILAVPLTVSILIVISQISSLKILSAVFSSE